MPADPDIIFRRATPADAPAIADLHAASWRSAYRGILSDAYLDGAMSGDRHAVWAERFEAPINPDQVVVVAQNGQELVALACILAGEDARWGSLVDNLHVHPDWKRQRIGGRALAAALQDIPERHAARPVFLTVFEANVAAQAAYERWGGELAERLMHPEADGQAHAIRRYAWASPAALMAAISRS